MQYLIFGGNLPAVSIRLDQGEAIYTQSGGMAWMTDGIDMSTNMRGGLMGGLGPVLLCGGGGQGQREGKDQRQEQGGPSAAKVCHRIFLSDMEVGFIIAEARALSREWKAENCAYFSTILSSDHSQRTIFLKTEKI